LLLLLIGTNSFVVTVARCSFIFHSCTDHKCLLHFIDENVFLFFFSFSIKTPFQTKTKFPEWVSWRLQWCTGRYIHGDD